MTLKFNTQARIGAALVWLGEFIVNCLLAFAVKYVEKKKEKGELDMANSFWNNMWNVALAGIASYGTAKLANKETSWAPYRDELVQGLSTVALTIATQQIAKIGAEKGAENLATQAISEVAAETTAKMAANPQEVIKAAKPVVDKLNDKINDKVSEVLHKKK